MFAVIAFICAVCGTALAVPQCLRIIRSRSTAGVSLLSWQLWGMVGLAWAMHGVLVGSLGMIVPNMASALFACIIMGMIIRDRRLPAVQTIAFPLVGVAIAVAVRWFAGPLAFGFLMLVPQAVAVLGQTLDLVRCADLFGVSGHYLRLAVVMQTLWLCYGLLGADIACTISSIMMICLVSTNLTLYVLRRRGRLVARPNFATLGTERVAARQPLAEHRDRASQPAWS